MCRILGVSRAQYYRYRSPKPSKRRAEDAGLKQRILRIFAEFKGSMIFSVDGFYLSTLNIIDPLFLAICHRNTQVLRMDYKYKNTATGKSTNLAYYMDLKNHDMYMAITPIMSISSSSLYKKSDLAVFDGKYLKTHAEGSNSANASTSFSSLLTDTKFQSGSKKDLEKVLKDADEKKFKQKDDKISYTFNGKQLAKLYKLSNARLKEKKATKDLALTDSQLKNMTEAMKKMKLTETVNVKTNEITSYKLKQGGATYNIKSKISKSNVKITVPDEQDVMSQAEMQKEMSKIIEKSLKN
ncbi:transposase [Secundilactobacillus oryzae JCM 18671]|uniref:Transposase n=1 Tax=Secundilactobacillus oryzae JCM 18671 TaxID=1291743 RepID=A0A081BHR4_9LACO|nr:hypothetical protein [Secundilactobacillus oryzae]GAK47582.1 transposase [Secundilactobacillus oryzae JCM 18671]